MAGAGGIGGIGGGIGGGFDLLAEMRKATAAAAESSAGSAAGGTEAAGGAEGFGALLRGQLDKLNTQQAGANTAMQDMATGSVDDVAQTMMRIEQANVGLQMATQVRNKVIEAYTEVLRMQI